MLGLSGCMQVCALPPHNVTQPNKDVIILATADPAASQPDTQSAVTASATGKLAYKTLSHVTIDSILGSDCQYCTSTAFDYERYVLLHYQMLHCKVTAAHLKVVCRVKH